MTTLSVILERLERAPGRKLTLYDWKQFLEVKKSIANAGGKLGYAKVRGRHGTTIHQVKLELAEPTRVFYLEYQTSSSTRRKSDALAAAN